MWSNWYSELHSKYLSYQKLFYFDKIITRSCEYPFPFLLIFYHMFFKPNVSNKINMDYNWCNYSCLFSLVIGLPNVAWLSQVIYLVFYSTTLHKSIQLKKVCFSYFGFLVQFIEEIFEDFLIKIFNVPWQCNSASHT